MIRSLHYASQAAPMKSATDAPPSEEERANLTAWLKVWYRWSAAAFLKSYLATAAEGSFLPTERESLSVLLNAYLLDKAALELSYELLVRPERVAIPLDGMLELLQHC
jgi:maltose alpha-D-glucosyltransferase/alpha-amylase